MESQCVACGSTVTRRAKYGPVPRFCTDKRCRLDRQKQATQRWVAKNPERARAARRASTVRFQERNPQRRREWDLSTRFGLTPQDYAAMLAAQGGVCAICAQPETAIYRGRVLPLAVDHCHATGKIRGLLCGACNRAIGMLRDDPKLVARAARYLRAHRV